MWYLTESRLLLIRGWSHLLNSPEIRGSRQAGARLLALVLLLVFVVNCLILIAHKRVQFYFELVCHCCQPLALTY